MDTLSGLLVVDKPAGLTSHDVVDRIRRRWLRLAEAGPRPAGQWPKLRVGHGGTLDPMATGVLLLLLGGATKSAEQLLGLDKEYEATVQLGVTTDTQDLQGRPLSQQPVPAFTLTQVEQACARFRGDIEQVVPAYSAVRFGGRRGYELARAGEPVPEKRRRVQVTALEVRDVQGDRLSLRVACSKGTYVRTLAHDLGQALGCGGALAALRRTRVGPWSLVQAHALAELDQATANQVAAWTLPVSP